MCIQNYNPSDNAHGLIKLCSWNSCENDSGRAVNVESILKPANSFPLMEINKLLSISNTIKKQMLSRPATPYISHPSPSERLSVAFERGPINQDITEDVSCPL